MWFWMVTCSRRGGTPPLPPVLLLSDWAHGGRSGWDHLSGCDCLLAEWLGFALLRGWVGLGTKGGHQSVVVPVKISVSLSRLMWFEWWLVAEEGGRPLRPPSRVGLGPWREVRVGSSFGMWLPLAEWPTGCVEGWAWDEGGLECEDKWTPLSVIVDLLTCCFRVVSGTPSYRWPFGREAWMGSR